MTEEKTGKVLMFADMMATELERDEVECPEWGGVVPIRELAASDRTAMTKRLSDGRGKIDWDKIEEFAPFLLVHGVTDADGNLYLTNKNAKALQTRSSKVVDRIAKAIAALSGLSKEAQKDAVKN